jgi:Zn finger protein HypA/HybF involved in hydrogenase expression
MKNLRLSSIIQSLLAQKTERASIQLAVGELVLDPPQLLSEWSELTKHTPLAKTKLNIRIIPAEQQCMWCFLIYHPTKKETACPQCRSVGAKILSGEEFYLESD